MRCVEQNRQNAGYTIQFITANFHTFILSKESNLSKEWFICNKICIKFFLLGFSLIGENFRYKFFYLKSTANIDFMMNSQSGPTHREVFVHGPRCCQGDWINKHIICLLKMPNFLMEHDIGRQSILDYYLGLYLKPC
jgi:hypothetical protein